MSTRGQRWTSLALSSILCGGLTLVGALGTSGNAGAMVPALGVTPSLLSFGEATLGTYAGPISFTMTNSSSSAITVTFGFSGTGADDYAWNFESNCAAPLDAAGEIIPIAATSSCTVDVYFFPGALGERDAALTLTDDVDPPSVVSLTGNGGIGYYQVSAEGAVGYAGDAVPYGDASNLPLNHPIVGMATTGDDGGYWLVASDGGIFNYGDAPFFGSAGGIALNKPIVGMAASYNANGPSGYWLVASDGGIFNYGQAPFHGSAGGMRLNSPIVGMAPTPDGGGYWLVAADGGIFSYGDAQFYGSAGAMHLNKPIVGMAPTPDGGGYWLVAADGGIFSYGDALFHGSAGNLPLVQPMVGMAAMPDGGGYWFSAADGGLFNYGNAPFYGSGTGLGLGEVVGMATDGEPTLQASVDAPAIRPHLARPGAAASHGAASGPRYFSGS